MYLYLFFYLFNVVKWTDVCMCGHGEWMNGGGLVTFTLNLYLLLFSLLPLPFIISECSSGAGVQGSSDQAEGGARHGGDSRGLQL
jgi:hypothetical protein